jgi:hypothetical protein
VRDTSADDKDDKVTDAEDKNGKADSGPELDATGADDKDDQVTDAEDKNGKADSGPEGDATGADANDKVDKVTDAEDKDKNGKADSGPEWDKQKEAPPQPVTGAKRTRELDAPAEVSAPPPAGAAVAPTKPKGLPLGQVPRKKPHRTVGKQLGVVESSHGPGESSHGPGRLTRLAKKNLEEKAGQGPVVPGRQTRSMKPVQHDIIEEEHLLDEPSGDNILLQLPFEGVIKTEHLQLEGKECLYRAGDGAAKAEHYLAIRNVIKVEDLATLEPGIYLNDAIVDFWMQWYVICKLG